MEFHLPIILFFIFSILSFRSYADQTFSPESYWKKVLPNTSMPKAITDSLYSEWSDNKGTSVSVGKGGVGVQTGKPYGGGGTHVSVGHGGVGVQTGKPYGHGGGTHVSVGHGGGVGVSTGHKSGYGGTTVGVGHGGVTVHTGPKHKPVYVAVGHHGGPNPFIYNYAATETQLHDDPNVALFFLHKELKPGTKKTLHFPRSTEEEATFLPRHVATSIPFSTAELPTILRRFSIAPESDEAAVMKQTVKECEQSDVVVGEVKYCATSLESMVDFAVSKLGGKESVSAVSTDAESDDGKRKEFTITDVSEVNSDDGELVACHKERYPYAVFYCHKTGKTTAYKVELKADQGKVVEAVAVCHEDTSAWNPKHLAFRVLKVKPGSVPVCHFLPEDHVVWVRN